MLQHRERRYRNSNRGHAGACLVALHTSRHRVAQPSSWPSQSILRKVILSHKLPNAVSVTRDTVLLKGPQWLHTSDFSQELRLTTLHKTLNELWGYEVIDRTIDAFLYRWSPVHCRRLQYRWSTACAVYYCKLRVDSKYASFNPPAEY